MMNNNFNNLYRNMYGAMNNNNRFNGNCNNNRNQNNNCNQNSNQNNNFRNNCNNSVLKEQATTTSQASDNLSSKNISPENHSQAENNAEKLKSLKGVSPEKVNLISNIIKQSETVSSENLIPFFLNAASTANQRGITFSDEETDLIINCLKTNMTPEQITKIDTVRKLANIISAGKTN